MEQTMPVSRLVVFRFAPDFPPDWLPEDMDGKWIDLDDEFGPPTQGTVLAYLTVCSGKAIARFNGKYERRLSDGMTARVYEIRAETHMHQPVEE